MAQPEITIVHNELDRSVKVYYIDKNDLKHFVEGTDHDEGGWSSVEKLTNMAEAFGQLLEIPVLHLDAGELEEEEEYYDDAA